MNNNLDFRLWNVKGDDADWEFKSNGSIGLQKYNTNNPTLLLHNSSFGEKATLNGHIKVVQKIGNKDNDNDWIGLVFGYKDYSNYYRVDWTRDSDVWHNAKNKNDGIRLVKMVDGKDIVLDIDTSYHWQDLKDYSIKVHYEKGLIQVFVNGSKKLEYKEKDLKIEGKVGFYGLSQGYVEYSNFTLKTSPKCPTGFGYDNASKYCLRLPSPSDNNTIHSTCKMNGHVGYLNTVTGIVSAKAGSEITENQFANIKKEYKGIFDLNNSKKVNKEERIEFWDGYKDHYLGFLEFIDDVAEKDRKANYSPKNKLAYDMGYRGFTSIMNSGDYTYYSSLDTIGYGMTDEECNQFAINNGLTRLKESDMSFAEKALFKRLSGDRLSIQYEDPVCSSGVYSSGSCLHAEKGYFKYCLHGKINANGTKCTIFPRCNLRGKRMDNQGFNLEDYAYKEIKNNKDFGYFCSKFDCKDGKCKTETCRISYEGELLPKSIIDSLDTETCTKQECDGNKKYEPLCGKKGGCPKGDSYVPAPKDSTTCYEYTCGENGTFNPKTKTCKVLACPDGTIEQSDGTCRKK